MGSLVGGLVSLGATVGQSYISRELRLNEPLPASRPAGEALRVTKVTQQIIDGQSWAFAGHIDLADLAELNGLDENPSVELPGREYMRKRGAVDVGRSEIELEIEGNRPGPVRVTGITAVPECREPLSGTLFVDKNQGGDAVLPMGFDLAQERPVARLVKEGPDGWPRLGDPYFEKQKVTLDQGEQETLWMSVLTDTGFCEYRPMLRCSSWR
ncbi:hypothetical protein EDD29_5443 [Actinocorallia herbida]|uniref:Uncharacterized protein n=1 Tax=Actinocorallia herbida TaxID=58109 RepID=A0A3N1D2Q1_9ACTN|nr:hypothetical protein [Actinocorallia herbida]ROO87801.1 hypothetical protein EDD29_5443 [Actinocorallia herbida]